MEYLDHTPKDEERNIVRHHFYKKSLKQMNISNIIWGLVISFGIIKVFLTNPDIITCDKAINLCMIEERPFYAFQYTVKEKFSITRIKSVKPGSCILNLSRSPTNYNFFFSLGKKSVYAYDCFGFARWNTRDQYRELEHFLTSGQQKIVLKEPLAKTFASLFLILFGLFPLFQFPKKKK